MKTTILIPDTSEHGKQFKCVFEPASNKTQISLTLNDEEKPFVEASTSNRSNEIRVYMKRGKRLDFKNNDFTKPLKKGDAILVKVVHQNGIFEEKKVIITEKKKDALEKLKLEKENKKEE